MRASATLLIGLILAVASPPLAGAGHASTGCNPAEPMHAYSGSYGVDVGTTNPFNGERLEVAVVVTLDPCLIFRSREVAMGAVTGPAVSAGGDGEAEAGASGASFPAGTSACVANAHHGFGPGAQYWADETFGFNVVYAAGADGPALLQDPTASLPCGTDGIVSGDPFTDPLDCGAGELGVHMPGFAWTLATLGETVPGNGACNPYDGIVWGWLLSGALSGDTGAIVISTPLEGHFWG